MSEDPAVAVLEQPTSSCERPQKPLVLQSWQHGFWSLVVTQFQGAFNDNAYKNLVVFLILGTGLAKADRDRLVLVAGALFSVPFILFSMTGGFLADRFSKRTVTIGTKLLEIAVMLLAAAGLAWQNLNLEMAAIFLASTQAAFFGPSKYGLLPTRIGQMLPFRRGMERIVQGVDVPIIPVNLGGVWGSIFSFDRGRFLWKLPRKIPYPVTVTFGNAMPSTSSAQSVRQAVQELGAEAYKFRKRYGSGVKSSLAIAARQLSPSVTNYRISRLL